MQPNREEGVGGEGCTARGRTGGKDRKHEIQSSRGIDLGAVALGLGSGGGEGRKNEVSGKRKEREMAVSCFLANKMEGSEPWPPSPPMPLLSHQQKCAGNQQLEANLEPNDQMVGA